MQTDTDPPSSLHATLKKKKKERERLALDGSEARFHAGLDENFQDVKSLEHVDTPGVGLQILVP